MKDFQLRALVQVAESGSIRAAARALGLSQPAVTKAIRDLEADVDAELVHRGAGGVTLTESGKQLTLRARLANAQLDMALQDIRVLQGGKRADVAVAVTPVVFMGALPQVLQAFKREMPQAQVRLFEGLMPLALPQLREGHVHFAVAALMEQFVDPDLDFEPICTLEMMVACRVGHPLAGATTWEELMAGEWLVHQASGSHHSVLFDKLRREGQPVPQQILEANTFGVAWGVLTRSDLLLSLPARFLSIEPYARQIVRVPLRWELPALTLGILKLRGTPMSMAAERLARLFARHCR
jgi:molybdate transport repressor ModE-like protein